MLVLFRRFASHVCTPDALDMIEHYRTRAERLADMWVHIVGLTLAAVGGIILAVLSAVYGGAETAMATAIYALCLIAMLTCSTIYNLTHPCAARPVLRRMDEAAIFLMIAGSYTPFTTLRFEGAWSIGFTVLVWGFALAGVFAKMLAPRISDAFWSGVYVLFGWLAVFALKPMIETVHPAALALLVLGGLIYTASQPNSTYTPLQKASEMRGASILANTPARAKPQTSRVNPMDQAPSKRSTVKGV